AQLRSELVHERLADRREVDVADARGDMRGERQQPPAEMIGTGLVAPDHVVAVQRVEDAVDGRSRQPERLGEGSDREAGILMLDLAEHVHHAVDDWDRMPARSVVRHALHRSLADYRMIASTIGKLELSKFIFGLIEDGSCWNCARSGRTTC